MRERLWRVCAVAIPIALLWLALGWAYGIPERVVQAWLEGR